MSLNEQNEIVTASDFVADGPRICIRCQTNRSIRHHLPEYLRGRRFQQDNRGRMRRQVRLGLLRAQCTFDVYAPFGREVVAYVEIHMLSAYHRLSRDNSQEVCLSGADNFLKDGDVRRDNMRVARSIDSVIAVARTYFRNLIIGMQSFSVHWGAQLWPYHNLEIVEGTETVTISKFEVAYDFLSASPDTTVRGLAPLIRALAREPETQSYRSVCGERNRIDGLETWARMTADRIAKLYVKTVRRVRFECVYFRRRIRTLAVTQNNAPLGGTGSIEIFSRTFFRAAEEIAALANNVLHPPPGPRASEARTVHDLISGLTATISNAELRQRVLDRLIAEGRVPSRLHYRVIPRLAHGAAPILCAGPRGIYLLTPGYQRAIEHVRNTPGVYLPLWMIVL